MVQFDLLCGLSYAGSVRLLKEEGYIEEKCIEKEDSSCDKLFLYPFSLYIDGKLIDRIYHAEYCNLDADGEYEEYKVCWMK